MARNRGKKKVSLYDYTREWMRPEDLPLLTQELMAGTDRACAIVACAVVDTALANALKVRFAVTADSDAMLYGQTAFLGTFSSRIRLGHALAIFGTKAFDLLNNIRNVRNAFAHSVRPIGFDHPLVVEQFEKWPSMQLSSPPATASGRREKYIAICNEFTKNLTDYAAKHSKTEVAIGFDVLT